MQRNPIFLGVNIDHVATLRQARLGRYPDPVKAALDAEEAGADSITLHLREDRRHIQEMDLDRLCHMRQTKVNLEMAVTDAMVDIALKYQPEDVCLVPEGREELTTEGGLDVVTHFDRVKAACDALADKDIRVSLFIDAEEEQIYAAKEAGAPVVELHTGHYAESPTQLHQAWLDKFAFATKIAQEQGLQVNAGHGLNYHNVQPIAAIGGLVELNIGHSIVAHAVFVGFKEAVRQMKALMVEARTTWPLR